MDKQQAERLVQALFEEIDEDELLGSMLYCMTDGEKRRLAQRLAKRIMEHEGAPA